MAEKKQHKTPCKECPFRRVAPAGWLGGMTADEFRHLADLEQRMPCHLHMGREGGKGGPVVSYANPGNAPQCAGRAIYWANQFKLPRSKDGDILTLPRDTAAVFNWPGEFVEYHKSGPLAERRTESK